MTITWKYAVMANKLGSEREVSQAVGSTLASIYYGYISRKTVIKYGCYDTRKGVEVEYL